MHDYPHTYYPDEEHFIKRSLAFGSGDLNPHWFHKPAFQMYVLFFIYTVYYTLGWVAGSWTSTSEFAVSFVVNPGPFILIGRLATVAFGVAGVIGVVKIGEKHVGRNVGLLAGAILAITFGHVEASQHVKADVPASTLCIWSMYFLLNHVSDRRVHQLYIAAALAGIGAAIKYYPIVMLGPIIASVGVGIWKSSVSWRRGSKQALIALAWFWLIFFVCSPYNFLDPLGRRGTFGPLIELLSTAHAAHETNPDEFIDRPMSVLAGTADYVRVVMSTQGMGFFLGLLGVLGLAQLLTRQSAIAAILVMYPLLFGAASVVKYPGYAEPRHQTSCYPFLAVAGSSLIMWLTNTKLLQPRIARVATGSLIAACMIWPLTAVIQHGVELRKVDTRNAAKKWIENEIPNGTKILASEMGPPLHLDLLTLRRRINAAKSADGNGQFTAHYGAYLEYQLLASDQTIGYQLEEIRAPWWSNSVELDGVRRLDSEYDRDMANPLKPVGVEKYSHYVTHGFEYAVVHSYHYEMFVGQQRLLSWGPPFHSFYTDLLANGELIKEFAPSNGSRGPVVRVYRFQPSKSSIANENLSSPEPLKKSQPKQITPQKNHANRLRQDSHVTLPHVSAWELRIELGHSGAIAMVEPVAKDLLRFRNQTQLDKRQRLCNPQIQ